MLHVSLPVPEDADLLTEPHSREQALPPQELCKEDLLEAPWRHNQKPRGRWAKVPKHPQGLPFFAKWAEEADAGGKCGP